MAEHSVLTFFRSVVLKPLFLELKYVLRFTLFSFSVA